MNSFTAYFDAGGKSHRPGVLSIAGFVSDSKTWERFDKQWSEILDRESINTFHMTDFVSSWGEFKDWREQPDRRKKLIADLLACARKYTNKAFGGAVVLRDYRRVNQLYQLQEHAGTPYPLCGNYCVRLLKAWQAKKGIRHLIIAFEDGDEDRGQLIKLCQAHGVVSSISYQETSDGFSSGRSPSLANEAPF